MLLFLGSVQFVPVVALLFFAIAGALVLAAWSALVTPVEGPVASTVAVLIALAGVVVCAEAIARWRARRREPRWLATLAELAASRMALEPVVGGKALGLAALVRAGRSVPPTLVLCREAGRRVLTGQPLPRRARARLAAFLRSLGGAPLVARSSFPGEDGDHLHAGVYDSVRDVDSGSPEAVLEAVRRVLASADGPAARAYRERHGLDGPPAGAVVLQRQVGDSLLAVAASRPPDGRSDAVVFDTCAPGAAWQSWHLDLASGAPMGRAPSDAMAWAPEVARALVALEHEQGGPVQVELAIDGASVSWLQLRPAPAAPASRRAWVNGGLVEARPVGDHDAVRALRGDPACIARVLSASGAGVTVGADEVRLFDGVPYVDGEAVRRLLASARAGWRDVLRALLGRVPAPARGAAYEALALAQAAVTRDLVVNARVRAELVALQDAAAPALISLPQLVVRLLDRRRPRLAAARDRFHDALLAAEQAAVGGDPELPTSWPTRRYEPPLPPSPVASDTVQRGAAVCGGRARGAVGTTIVVLPDGDPRWTPRVTAEGVEGVVLCGGGVLSHVATTALELGLPTVLLLDGSPPPDGAVVEVDGDAGTVTLTPP